jgi:hypothetical protein
VNPERRPNDGPPARRRATFARDGWSLLEVERAYRARDGVYWVPPAGIRSAIRRGNLAQLLFAWAEAGPDDPGRERLWVDVARVDEDGAFAGRLVNEPAAVAPVGHGDWIWAGPEHVLDLVAEPGGEPLAARSGLLRCPGHGWSEPCLVCEHLPRGEGLGFHAAPGDGAGLLRPDAWCDACEARARPSSRPDRGGAPRAVAICGGCYDRLRDLHRRDRR